MAVAMFHLGSRKPAAAAAAVWYAAADAVDQAPLSELNMAAAAWPVACCHKVPSAISKQNQVNTLTSSLWNLQLSCVL